MVSYSQWCRIEGTNIPNIEKQYGLGKLKNLSNYPIFYGTPEIQLHNPTSLINGCRYLLVSISSYGWNTIQEIDDNFQTLLQKINDQNKSANLGTFYYRPFVVTESTLIFHNDTTKDLLSLVGMVFVDQYATPAIKRIGVAYNGKNVKVDENYEDEDLLVTAIYEDGTTATIEPMGYKVFNSDGQESKKITNVGGNLFTVSYTSNGITYTNTFSVPGIKRITGITGIYDGPKVGVGNTVNKKYFIISVLYSDGSKTTITDFQFTNGMIVTEENKGLIDIYYQGFETKVQVVTYEVKNSRLIAMYAGPVIEKGKDFLKSDVKIKIYYEASDTSNSYYETIDPELCNFSTTTITTEGTNYITISYEGKLGLIVTQFTVTGVKKEVVLNYITAVYSGPDIVVNSFFNVTSIICKGYYSDGSISQIKGFRVQSNVINSIGENQIKVMYDTKETIVVITGIPKEDTTEVGLSVIKIKKEYPVGTRRNHRYRGPAESFKNQSTNDSVNENIEKLYKLFSSLQKQWENVIGLKNPNKAQRDKAMNQLKAMMEDVDEKIRNE